MSERTEIHRDREIHRLKRLKLDYKRLTGKEKLVYSLDVGGALVRGGFD